MRIKKIILAIPNSASQSLKACINEYSNFYCEQYMNLLEKPDIQIPCNGKLFPLKRAYSYIHNKLILPSYIENYQTKLNYILRSDEYEALANYHSDICNFNTKSYYHISCLDKENFIAKQHFPPTLSNRVFLRDFAKVILVRDPEEVVYKYEVQGGLLISNPEFKQKIIGEITKWIDLWSSEPDTLVISKNDLVSDPRRVLEQIGDYTGIKFDLGEGFEFPKINKSKPKFNV